MPPINVTLTVPGYKEKKKNNMFKSTCMKQMLCGRKCEN
jgi:hypothetical protein